MRLKKRLAKLGYPAYIVICCALIIYLSFSKANAIALVDLFWVIQPSIFSGSNNANEYLSDVLLLLYGWYFLIAVIGWYCGLTKFGDSLVKELESTPGGVRMLKTRRIHDPNSWLFVLGTVLIYIVSFQLDNELGEGAVLMIFGFSFVVGSFTLVVLSWMDLPLIYRSTRVAIYLSIAAPLIWLLTYNVFGLIVQLPISLVLLCILCHQVLSPNL